MISLKNFLMYLNVCIDGHFLFMILNLSEDYDQYPNIYRDEAEGLH